MNKRTNPFKFGSIVSGKFFYNREDELSRIKQTLAGGNNITLYAPRRYGKSSLVNKVLKKLKDEGYVTVYLDFMSVYSYETFVKNYAKIIANSHGTSIEKTVKKIAKFISGIVPSVSFDNSGMPAFSLSWIEGENKEQTLIDIINLPEKLATKESKWIIAFDEFQEVTKLNGDNFEKLLRSCIQNHKNVSYLFLGSKIHLLQDMFNNKNRAFYNAASVMGIDKIDKDKSVDYLKTRFMSSEINIEQTTSEYLLDIVANIPYYIQFIAYEIWQFAILDGRNTITHSDVDEAIENMLIIKSDYYWELTNKQTAYRKKVLHAISQSVVELFSKQAAAKYNLGAVSSTQKALEAFIEDGIIERNNGNYEFSDPIYKIFINRHL